MTEPKHLRIAIIEDEPKTRSFLKALVTEKIPHVSVIAEAHSVRSGLDMITEHQPEAILLDVEMGDGTGFDLLTRLKGERPHVIFVTAYDHYAVQALRSGAVDYIEKPVNPAELMDALAKVRERITREEPPDYDKIMRSMQHRIAGKIAVPTRSGQVYLAANDILCVKADGAYAQIIPESPARPIVISRTLKDIQPALENLGFVRIHRSYLINATKIAELNKTDGGYVVLTDGQRVPFSKQFKEEGIRIIREMTTSL